MLLKRTLVELCNNVSRATKSKQSTAQLNQTVGRSEDMAASMHIFICSRTLADDLVISVHVYRNLCPRLQEGYQGLHNLLWPAQHARNVMDQHNGQQGLKIRGCRHTISNICIIYDSCRNDII